MVSFQHDTGFWSVVHAFLHNLALIVVCKGEHKHHTVSILINIDLHGHLTPYDKSSMIAHRI